MSDPELISERARIRAELEQLPRESEDWRSLAVLYSAATQELDDRARLAWSGALTSRGPSRGHGAHLPQQAAVTPWAAR